MWLPTVGVHSGSSSAHGHYQSATNDSTFVALYESPRYSKMAVRAFLRPSGGLEGSDGAGGVGLLPRKTYEQSKRPARSHKLLVQTPKVYTNMRMLRVLVQPYDAHGHSGVSSAPLSVTASLSASTSGTSQLTLSYDGSVGNYTRRYSVSVPESWFSAAAVQTGSQVTLTSVLSGGDTHTGHSHVFGTPAWFGERLGQAGIAAYMTSDAAGATPAETMRAGDTFYVQLYAHTGGEGLTSFEVKLYENASVCRPVPVVGGACSSYPCKLQGELSGTYQIEVLGRYEEPDDSSKHFISYSRLSKLEALSSEHGHLWYVKM